MYHYLTTENIESFIKAALEEDIKDGDHSSLGSIPEDAKSKAKLLIKDQGILAGIEMAQHIFRIVDSELKVNVLLQDGTPVKYGDIGLTVEGKAQSILQAERLVLNCMQRMSGIATYTKSVMNKVAHTDVKILDTRKTTPNFRLPEKWAVKIGGATNHRYGLFDMVMLKDNHIDFAGGIENAINATHEYFKKLGKTLDIVIETRNLEEVAEVSRVGKVNRIMLDNMDVPTMKKAIEIIDGKFTTEASGGITLENIGEIAESGVDFISLGALTHSSRNIDISLKAF